LLFMVAMIVPSVVASLVDNESLTILHYIVIFITYLGLAFIATFFNVCVVYTAKVRFEGGNATFSESIRFGFSKFGLIFQWSLLSASVGLLLRLLDNLVSRLGKIGEIVGHIIVGLIGMTWSIVTIFVVPVLVYENIGPIDAVKKSIDVLKKTWGESLIKSIGLGLIQIFTLLLIAGFSIALVFVLNYIFNVTGLLIGIGVGILLLVITTLLFQIASTIYNAALYAYATEGKIVEGFNEEIVRGAFRQR
jgi:hypothetical protein